MTVRLVVGTKMIHIKLRRYIHVPGGSVILVIMLMSTLKVAMHANVVVLHVGQDRHHGHKCQYQCHNPHHHRVLQHDEAEKFGDTDSSLVS